MFYRKLYLLFNKILTISQPLEAKGCSFYCCLIDFLKKKTIIIVITYIHYLI